MVDGKAKKIIEDFAKYTRTCFQFFGNCVKYWITIYEARTIAIGRYEQGTKAPGFISEEQGDTGQ